MEIDGKLKALREKLKENGIDAYYITGSDAHLSEYVAPHWRTREFISGFTGSAGTVVITSDDAVLWTDSRYFIQAEAEIRGTEFRLLKLETDDPDPLSWILSNLKEGEAVGFEKSEISIRDYLEKKKKMEERGIRAALVDGMLSSVWPERPAIPCSRAFEMPLEYAGKSAEEKIGEVRAALREKGAEWTFIAGLDDIAWLTNLRSDDIPYNPVFYSFFFLSMDKAILFTDKKRFESVSGYPFTIMEYGDAYTHLAQLVKGRGYYNDDKISASFISIFSEEDIKGRDITTDIKACKNDAEKEGMRRSHVEDAAAYINFLAKLDRNVETDEIAVSTALEVERKRRDCYLGPSFAPISAFRENGAMCHYSATEKSNKQVKGNGLLVLDTGSQFEFGMTDITRTLLFGSATEEQKRDYTLVLKGHLALSRQRFIKGTRGVQLDVLAKQFLWQVGESFFHGTGHGVGCHLNVHEGPMRISGALIDVPLMPGMVISDEPGVYKEGRHGIRIENLLMVREDIRTEFGEFYSFEVLTLVPYEKDLLDLSLLTDEEIRQIDAYHKRIWDELSGKVDENSLDYLRSATSPISCN